MNQSRIEQTIEQIYAFIEECKASKLYPNKVVVAKDELYDLLDALRLCAPEEIKRYKKIISNRDAILNEAYQKAEEVIVNAKEKNAQLLDQNEIVQAASEHAEQIVKEADKRAEQMIYEANEDAERIRNASLMYTNDLLTNAEQIMNRGLQDINSKHLEIESTIEHMLNVIKNNKEELKPKNGNPAETLPETGQQDDPEAEQEGALEKEQEGAPEARRQGASEAGRQGASEAGRLTTVQEGS